MTDPAEVRQRAATPGDIPTHSFLRSRAVPGKGQNRSEPAKKSGQNIPKNRFRTTVAERIVETLAELPFIGDQVVCLSRASDDAAR